MDGVTPNRCTWCGNLPNDPALNSRGEPCPCPCHPLALPEEPT